MSQNQTKTGQQFEVWKTEHVSEHKTKMIGNTTYSVGLAYKEGGEPLRSILLQLMMGKQQGGNG